MYRERIRIGVHNAEPLLLANSCIAFIRLCGWYKLVHVIVAKLYIILIMQNVQCMIASPQKPYYVTWLFMSTDWPGHYMISADDCHVL